MSRGATLILLAVLVTASFAAAVGAPTPKQGDRWDATAPAASGSTREIQSIVSESSASNWTLVTTEWTNTSGTPAVPPLVPAGAPTVTISSARATFDAAGALVGYRWSPPQQQSGVQQSFQNQVVTFDAPCPLLKFPLTVGTQWSVDCKGKQRAESGVQAPGSDGTPFEWKYDYSVVSHENVTLTNTTVTLATYKVVNITGGKAGEVSWYAPAACAVVKKADATGKTTYEVKTFTCAAPVADDYVPPAPVEEKPPVTETPPDDDMDMGDDNMTDDMGDDDTDTTPPPAEPEKKGFLGLPAPGALALVALLGAAAVAWKRR